MALAGIPQFAFQRYIFYSGGYASSNEVDCIATQNQDSTGIFSGNASHTITAGPTTAGPVPVSINGITFFLPFNVACTAPNECWNSLNPVTLTGSQTTVTASIWTWA